MTVNRIEEFVVHDARVLGTLRDRMCGAVMQVISKKRPRDTTQGLLHRGNLSNDVRTVAIFFNHLVETANLAFDSTQPFEVGGLNVRIDCNRLAFTLTARKPHNQILAHTPPPYISEKPTREHMRQTR